MKIGDRNYHNASPERRFLSAEWRYLVMLNYKVNPEILWPYVPLGTELDSFDGRTFISLVGFRFLRTRVYQIPFPFHRDFDEVNLRFYVRRHNGKEVRRGVVFIREVVPRLMIAAIARLAYNEHYVRFPMEHTIDLTDSRQCGMALEYRWRDKGRWNRLYAQGSGIARVPEKESIEQFISEHYWGYSAHRGGGCLEYKVEHAPWRMRMATSAGFEGDAANLYGAELARTLKEKPDSAFIAEGSPVVVYAGRRIT
ncbi:MAG TPA: DUF2071 domain-containing protein [Terriglobia bacterium]|nr:DUF2071 domain-containing protein [Terriglobia bacterium]